MAVGQLQWEEGTRGTKDLIQDRARLWTAEAHDADATTTDGRGNGSDRVVQAVGHMLSQGPPFLEPNRPLSVAIVPQKQGRVKAHERMPAAKTL